MSAAIETIIGGVAPRLAMSDISKSFGGVTVLADVAFSVAPGEVVALLGSNGAGKSTLMKILTGVYTRDAGSIAIDGEVIDAATPREAAGRGISFLPQEISVIPDMTVAENISIAGLPTRKRLGFNVIDRGHARRIASDILGQLGFPHISPDAYVGDLSVAERRIVEIGRALASHASILVMDEPTASLTEQEAALIFRIIRRLKTQMTSVVYISHYLKEVFEISDRIEVLRDGRNAGSFIPSQTTPGKVVEAMLGRVAGKLFSDHTQGPARPQPLLEVRNLITRNGLDDISLTVGKGEIVGVFGLVGSGVEQLGRAIFGADGGRYSGTMIFDGRPYEAISPQHGKKTGIGFVTAERKKDGIIADLTLRQNLVAPFQRRHGSGLFTSKVRETAQTEHWIRNLRIKTNGPEQEMRTLSGGNQQKVCVARWLDPSVRMLILEEPTRGVDVGARRELYLELAKLAKQGLAILVLSSDVEEVAGLCDRSLVIDRGTIVARFDDGVEAGRLMEATATPAHNGQQT
ncbi:MAG: putative ATP-binding component of transporter [Rhizobium sp.]|nr:putative ATP-binding component of transporter [Rhizobium sp.]